MGASPHNPVRLACVRHAASVRPEPGSNSQKIVSKALYEPQIKFLNNSLLALITQEFSLAVFSLTLKQSIIIVQGVIVCLYVIQFTRYSVRSRFSFRCPL